MKAFKLTMMAAMFAFASAAVAQDKLDVLKVDPIKQYGTQVYIINTIFGGITKYREAIKELESAIYAA